MVNERESYNQTLEILKYMDKKYVEKIPKKLINYFNENKVSNYNFSINPEISLKEQNLSEKTLNILAMLNLNYWCTDEEHKKGLIKKYTDNQIKYEEESKQKYNIDDIFANKLKNENKIEQIKPNILESSNNLPQVPEKNKWYKSIINFIKRLFKSSLDK